MFVNKTNYRDYKFFTNGVRFNITHYDKVVRAHRKGEMKLVVDAPMFVGREILDLTTNDTYMIIRVIKRFHPRGGSYLSFILVNRIYKEIFFCDIDTEDNEVIESTLDFQKRYKFL